MIMWEDWRFYMAVFVIIFGLVGNIGYLIDVIHGKTKPNCVTYFFWSMPIISGLVAISVEFSFAQLLVIAQGAISILVVITALLRRNARWKYGWLDLICAVFAAATLLCYFAVKDPAWVIIFATATDVVATLPTAVKLYKYPETEIAWPYFTATVCCLLNLILIESWTFIEYVSPIYLAVINVALSFCIVFGNFRAAKIISAREKLQKSSG
jgi:hypothetical protein